jgi:hypothetical protein
MEEEKDNKTLRINEMLVLSRWERFARIQAALSLADPVNPADPVLLSIP